jgi:cell division protein FtsX
MYHITERNERRSRQHALVLAVSLHLALAGFLYLQMTDNTSVRKEQTVKVNVEKSRTTAKAKTVQMP